MPFITDVQDKVARGGEKYKCPSSGKVAELGHNICCWKRSMFYTQSTSNNRSQGRPKVPGRSVSCPSCSEGYENLISSIMLLNSVVVFASRNFFCVSIININFFM